MRGEGEGEVEGEGERPGEGPGERDEERPSSEQCSEGSECSDRAETEGDRAEIEPRVEREPPSPRSRRRSSGS